MKNIKKSLKNIFLGALFVGALVSCEDNGYDEYEPQRTALQEMSGEWWIDITDASTGDVYVQHALHKTYDNNNGGLVITDRVGSSNTFTGWWTDTVVNADPGSLTFSGSNLPNMADDSEVTITEGRIMKGAAHSRTGAVTDSIYFKGVYNYDPETVLVFSGHKRTGFEDDEF